MAGGTGLVNTMAGAMVIEKLWVAAGAVPLDAVMVPMKVPAAVGVPEITPPVLRVRPVGRAPAVTLKVMEAVPVAVTVKL